MIIIIITIYLLYLIIIVLITNLLIFCFKAFISLYKLKFYCVFCCITDDVEMTKVL